MKRAVFISVAASAAVLLRLHAFRSLDAILPLNGLYVDEKTFFGNWFDSGFQGFSRPPGMFLTARFLSILKDVPLSRIIMSLVSIFPAAILFHAFGRKNAWAAACSLGLALSPFMIVYGLFLMPAVPAAVLLSVSMAAASKGKYALSGFATGLAALFRAELLMVPLFILLLPSIDKWKSWPRFASMTAVAVMPVMLLNALYGAGPVISTNGGVNLWLGTDWTLLERPPGREYEEIMAVEDMKAGGDPVFTERALDAIFRRPGKWFMMGLEKVMAFLSLPGPGRNLEIGWILSQLDLAPLLLLTLFAMSLGYYSIVRGDWIFWKSLAASIVLSGILSAFIFFPSARFRTAVLPAFWFLAAGTYERPSRKMAGALAPMILILVISLTFDYRGRERAGLTSILAAEFELTSGNLVRSADYLEDATSRGFHGADLHNVRGVLQSLSGNTGSGLSEFGKALELAPLSPHLWRNYAVSLWTNGRYSESMKAARQAVRLNPDLREELRPILEQGGRLVD